MCKVYIGTLLCSLEIFKTQSTYIYENKKKCLSYYSRRGIVITSGNLGDIWLTEQRYSNCASQLSGASRQLAMATNNVVFVYLLSILFAIIMETHRATIQSFISNAKVTVIITRILGILLYPCVYCFDFFVIIWEPSIYCEHPKVCTHLLYRCTSTQTNYSFTFFWNS